MFRPLKPYQIVVDVSVAALLFLLTSALGTSSAPLFSVGLLPGFSSWGAEWLVYGVGFVLCAGLAVRRISPPLALLVVWIGALLQMAAGLPPLSSDIAILGVLYATAAYGSRLVLWLGFASAFAGAAAITLYLVLPPLVRGGWGLASALETFLVTGLALYTAAVLGLLLAWVAGALARTALRARENRLAQQRAEAEAVAEQERVRIARDMHDVVAHSLAVVIAQADGARYAAASDPAAATAALGTISSTARSALADARLLLTQLRHSQGDGPQPTLADLEELYAQVRAAGVRLQVDVDPAPPGEAPAGVQLAVFRILQEALTNALRHGDGGVVAVRLAWFADRVELEVRNGLRADAAPGAGPIVGHGVIGMRERAQLAGGRLDAGAEGDAFVVRATVPVGGAA